MKSEYTTSRDEHTRMLMSWFPDRDVVGGPTQLLWLCGPPGVGKTTVGWAVYRGLVNAGVDSGFVDIDQLGICYPEPSSDPGRHKLKARNLEALSGNFRAAGAQCVVVSGVLDVTRDRDVIEDANVKVTVCRLRADRDELQQRFVARGSPPEAVNDLLDLADALDAATIADLVVDTTGLSVVETARMVQERAGWPRLRGSTRSSRSSAPIATARDADGSIVWLYGATCVGKSTVGFALYQQIRRLQVAAAYIDVDQLGFCSPAPMDHNLRAANLASSWQSFRDAGAEVLVVVGPLPTSVSARPYAERLPAARFSWYGLHAGQGELTRRILQRGQGGSWLQPGDPLFSQSRPQLLRIAEQAAAEDAALKQMPLGMHIDTTTLDTDATARLILSQSLPELVTTRGSQSEPEQGA